MLRRLKNWITGDDPETREILSTALVVFHCSEKEAAAIDVAVGPCVWRVGPRGGRVKPIAWPSDQHYGSSLAQLEALYPILTDRPAGEAFEARTTQGSGTLARLSDPFAAALASLYVWDYEGDEAPWAPIAVRWSEATSWRSTMQLGGIEARVERASGAAFSAREAGNFTYAWEGPSVQEYAITRGPR